jgi:ABC-2 type transport system ATP-binding protein
MLETRELHKWFGAIHAVRGISFRADKGEVLGFLGPNGAGKTTTMRMITGFLPSSSGTAVVNGFDICDQPILAKKQIGYLPENAPVYRDMTVFNFLLFIAEIRGFSGKSRAERVAKTIEQCRLETVKHQSIETLSKGFKQRVGFAQAVLHDPPILIMDEPTDGLDPNQKHVVRGMIRDMAAEKAIVISTHILEEVEAVCTRAIIIADGAIVANGSPSDLKARSDAHGAVELIVKTPSPHIAAELRALPLAARVEDSGNAYIIYPRNADRLFPEVTALLRNRPQWNPLGLRLLEGRLDDVFRKLTAGGDGRARGS